MPAREMPAMGELRNSLSSSASLRIPQDRLLSRVLGRSRSARHPDTLRSKPPLPRALCPALRYSGHINRVRVARGSEGGGSAPLDRARDPATGSAPPTAHLTPGGRALGTGVATATTAQAGSAPTAPWPAEPLRSAPLQRWRKPRPAQTWPWEPHHVGGRQPHTEMAGGCSASRAPKSQPVVQFPWECSPGRRASHSAVVKAVFREGAFV